MKICKECYVEIKKSILLYISIFKYLHLPVFIFYVLIQKSMECVDKD